MLFNLINQVKSARKEIIAYYILSLSFIFINALAIIFDSNFLFLLPFILVVIFLAIWDLEKLILLIVFLVPISLPLREIVPGFAIDMNLPTEPLIFGAMLLFFYKLFTDNILDKKVIFHPISIVILFNLLWILVTSFTSTMPIVSLKFFLSRLWFTTCFYFLLILIFKNSKRINSYFWLYISSLVIVVVYTFHNHLKVGLFNKNAVYGVVAPIFNDHTAWGAALAMVIPIWIYQSFVKKNSNKVKVISFLILISLSLAFVFSYSRAAWLSLAAACVVSIVVMLKIRPVYLTFASIITLSILILNFDKISSKTEKTKDRTSIDISEHVASISNVSTDASNMERVNRWNCALRMFHEKPIMGWGPGTYMFKYAPFQLSNEKTIISTNFGDVGNAHSEYLGPLAESGFMGSLSFIAIILVTVFYVFRIFYHTEDLEIRYLTLAIFAGLVTYYVHGFLNNFLDTDKLSVLFWGYTAAIVAMDLRGKKILSIIKE